MKNNLWNLFLQELFKRQQLFKGNNSVHIDSNRIGFGVHLVYGMLKIFCSLISTA